MRAFAACTLLALALAAPASGAGLDLTWDACATNGGVSDVTFDCANPSAAHTLHFVFTSSEPLFQLRALDGIVQLQSDAAELPPFWNLQHPVTNPFACNGAWSADERRPSECTGAVPAAYTTPGIPEPAFEVTFTTPWGGSASRARMGFFARRDNWNLVSLPIVPGTAYYLGQIDFYTALAGSCEGCESPVVMVWDDLTAYGYGEGGYDGGAAFISTHVSGPGLVSNCASVNGAQTPCSATPAKQLTWGRLKSLYR